MFLRLHCFGGGSTLGDFDRCRSTFGCWRQRHLTRSSAIAEGPRDALRQLKYCQLLYKCTNLRKIPLEKACNSWMPYSNYSRLCLAPFPRYYNMYIVYVTTC